MSDPVERVPLRTWQEILEAIDYFRGYGWLFRGQEYDEWDLKTGLERELGPPGEYLERHLVRLFLRRAPGLMPPQLIPDDGDVAAWLGLIQHYGGPTRLLDVTRSAFVALFFAFEPNGDQARSLWALDQDWYARATAARLAGAAELDLDWAEKLVRTAQAQLVHAVVMGESARKPLPQIPYGLRGVFPVDPWKPDPRQVAQQAMFLCAADASVPFMENLIAQPSSVSEHVRCFTIPAALRPEILDRLDSMNLSAATLFPDLTGLARSLRSRYLAGARLIDLDSLPPPWNKRTRE